MDHHHRRIRRKAAAVHFGLIPLALGVPILWIYFAYGECQEAETPFMIGLCRALRFVPLAPALLGAAVCAWIAWDLARVGAEKHAESRGLKSLEPRWRHAVFGYRAIDDRHRRHVHLAAAQVLAVGAALAAWLASLAYRSTH